MAIVNPSVPKEQRVGQVGYNAKGEKMVIIAYRGCKDIDVQFVEYGDKAYNKSYSHFTRGEIAHPLRYEESFGNRWRRT